MSRRDHHHHGSLHQQDAAAERRAETAYRGRGLEGPLIGEHGRAYSFVAIICGTLLYYFFDGIR